MLATRLPNLFEKDPIDLTIKNPEFYAFITRLVQVKTMPYFAATRKFIINEHPLQSHLIEATLTTPTNQLVGYFNLTKDQRKVYTSFKDGTYLDLISQQKITIHQGILNLLEPLILVVS
jgi:hypothetical protein